MATFSFGDRSVEVDEVNEAAFEAAGWRREEEAKPAKASHSEKSEK